MTKPFARSGIVPRRPRRARTCPATQLTYHIVFNARSGGAAAQGLTPADLTRLFEEAGLSAKIDSDEDRTLADKIQTAVESDADVVVAAGGDGTVTALAGALLDTGKTLALLPLGTANLLARDLNIPLEVHEAVAQLAQMAPRRIDVGEINGTVFLHKVVVGLVPGIAAGREKLRGSTSVPAKLAFVRYFFRRLKRSRRIAVEIARDGRRPRIVRVQAIAVANNSYDEGIGRYFARSCLDGGKLTLYTLKRLDVMDLVKLSGAMLIGRWTRNATLSVSHAQEVTIRSARKRLMAMIDGEVRGIETPLKIKMRARALSILAPVPQPAETKQAS